MGAPPDSDLAGAPMLLLTEHVSIEAGAAAFAVELVVLGLLSRGFRR